MSAYEALAFSYDAFNREVDHAAFADFFEAAFDRYLEKRPELVLDLGCGTGSMTLELARRGYDMIGVDSSADMLSRAYERKWDAGLENVLLLQQDMRSFELYGTVGAVVSSLDCINYLTGEGELDRCFSLVHNYLDKDGIFLFDVNTPYKFKHVYGDNAYVLEDEVEGSAVYCGWQNHYDEETSLCQFELSLFEEREDGTYQRRDESHTERCYQKEQLTAALTATGFEVKGFFGGLDFSAPAPTCERWFVAAICKK